MRVVIMMKFNIPKELERNKKRCEFIVEHTQPYYITK